MEYPASSPIAGSLRVTDPGEFVYELSVRRDDQRCQDPGQGYLGLCRISHVRLEVTDLAAAAADWYRNTLGLVDTDQVPGDAQLTLAIPETRQLFILREVPEMTQRSLYPRGPPRRHQGGHWRIRRFRFSFDQHRALLEPLR